MLHHVGLSCEIPIEHTMVWGLDKSFFFKRQKNLEKSKNDKKASRCMNILPRSSVNALARCVAVAVSDFERQTEIQSLKLYLRCFFLILTRFQIISKTRNSLFIMSLKFFLRSSLELFRFHYTDRTVPSSISIEPFPYF